jgi:hypothetical protein
LRCCAGHNLNHHGNLPHRQIGHGLDTTLIENVHHGQASAGFINFAIKIRCGAIAGRTKGVPARVGFEQPG